MHVTVPSTDSERAPTPARAASTPTTGPHGLPQRATTPRVRQRNRVSLETLEATFAGLQQVDEHARPEAPLAPPADLWPPPETGSHPLVTKGTPRVSG